MARQALIQGYDPLDAAIAGVNVNELDPNDMTRRLRRHPERGGRRPARRLRHGRPDDAGRRRRRARGRQDARRRSRGSSWSGPTASSSSARGRGSSRPRTASRRGPPDGEDAEDLALLERAPLGHRRLDRGRRAKPRTRTSRSSSRSTATRTSARRGRSTCPSAAPKGDLAGVTTTSGLFFKIPGRVGDSAVVGAGVYSENGVGSCGSTGRGEANLVTCGSHTVVEFLRQGKSPEEACLLALKRIDEKTHIVPRHRDDEGPPEVQRQLLLRRRQGPHRRRRHLERRASTSSATTTASGRWSRRTVQEGRIASPNRRSFSLGIFGPAILFYQRRTRPVSTWTNCVRCSSRRRPLEVQRGVAEDGERHAREPHVGRHALEVQAVPRDGAGALAEHLVRARRAVARDDLVDRRRAEAPRPPPAP